MTEQPLYDETYEDTAIEFGPLAAMLRRARQLEGLSMRALARRSGLSAAQISRIETGDVKPSIETLAKLASALQRPLEPLLIMALYREPAEEGLEDVRRLLRGLERAGADELTGDLPEVDEASERLTELRNDHSLLEGKASAELQYLDRLRAAATHASREYTNARSYERQAGQESPGAWATELATRGREIVDEIGPAEASAKEAREAVDDHQRKLDEVESMVESLVFVTAEKLFLSVSGELLVCVRELTDLRSPAETETGQWADAVLFATLSLGQPRAQGAGDPETRELLRKWDALTDPRRKRVLEFIEDQRRLSAQELATDQTEGGDSAVPDQDEPE
jgi:transcriptional regulator with XRE-family HTH domain